MAIKKVIIYGLGAVGLAYAVKLNPACELKILADETRIKKFRENPPKFNGKEVKLDYILPNASFDADLIIISVKNSGLESAIQAFKGFVGEKTIIISLINGISSEEKIAQTYGTDKVIHSFYIGHSIMRNEKGEINYDGIGKIIFGSPKNSEKVKNLAEFFDNAQVDYEISDDIIYSQWVKLGVNICLNQLSAIHLQTVGELKRNPEYKEVSDGLISELTMVANAIGIKTQNLKTDILDGINKIADDGKTSMLQDILLKRKPEIELFSGEIIRLGKKYGIETPINKSIYKQLQKITN